MISPFQLRFSFQLLISSTIQLPKALLFISMIVVEGGQYKGNHTAKFKRSSFQSTEKRNMKNTCRNQEHVSQTNQGEQNTERMSQVGSYDSRIDERPSSNKGVFCRSSESKKKSR